MLELAIAIYFVAGFVIISGLLIWARLGAGEVHGSFWPWAPVTFALMVVFWPFLVAALIAGEIHSRKLAKERGGENASD